MNAYNKATSFKYNLGNYASKILGATEKRNISIPETKDGN
jgi:hypothetical protein